MADMEFESDDDESSPNVHSLLKVVILAVIGVVSVVGNLIAVFIVIRYRTLRTSIYVIIAGLALADIIVTLMNVPEHVIYYVDKGEIKSPQWCRAFVYLTNSGEYTAAFHLVVLVVLRKGLLTDRGHHRRRSIPALITSTILWVVSLLANIPMIYMTMLQPRTHECVVKINADDGEEKASFTISSDDERYILLNAALNYFLPMVLIIVIYIFTGYMSKRFFEDSYSPRERRMSKMISSIIVTFALCRLPSEMVELLFFYQTKRFMEENPIGAFINSKHDSEKLEVWIHVKQYLYLLAMIDMALRPVIYATMSREFGAIYDKVINCTYCKEQDEENARLKLRRQEINEVLTTPVHQPVVSIEVQGSEDDIQEVDSNSPLRDHKHYDESEDVDSL